jgi:outer membrane lipoprotein-sorting protein
MLVIGAVFLLAFLPIVRAQALQLDNSAVVRGIDAAIKARFDSILGFTVTEHYAVYRNKDEIHPAAEMTVKTVYRKDAGKSYTILSQTGSELIRRLVLGALLDNEKRINDPAVREQFWFTSANYEMKLKPGGTQRLDGRDCLVLGLSPRRKAPNLIEGTLWVDAKDYSTVQIQGTGSRSPSLLTGPTRMMRQYTTVSGFAQATHARAVSNSFLFGETILKIDYINYEIQLRPAE